MSLVFGGYILLFKLRTNRSNKNRSNLLKQINIKMPIRKLLKKMTAHYSTINCLQKPEVLALDLDLTLCDVIKHYHHSINQTIKHFGFSH